MKEAKHKRPYNIWFSLYEMSTKYKFIDTQSRLLLQRAGGKGDGVKANGHKEFYRNDRNTLKLDYGVGFVTW